MKESFKNCLIEHSVNGAWTGPTQDGVPVITYMGIRQPVEPFLAQLGIKLKKADKYSERLEHAGMGKPHTGGDTPDVGDGISQVKE